MSHEISVGATLKEYFISERSILEEYKELGLCWKHDDGWIAKLSAVLLPLSIAALTLPYLREGPPKLLGVAGGLTLMTFWYVSSHICKRRFEIRFSRIREIECTLGFDSHLRYHRESASRIVKHQRLRRLMFIVYIVIALLVACEIKVVATDRTVVNSIAQFIHALSNPEVDVTVKTVNLWPPFGLWPADAWSIKLFITPGTVLILLIVAPCIVAWICVWICILIRWLFGIGWRCFKRKRYDNRLKGGCR